MAKAVYKLSHELVGHQGDVRGLDVSPDGTIVSASRDKTACLWKFQDGNYAGNVVMTGHSNFVSTVCIIGPSPKHPKGFIVTGSNDSHIFLYIPGETQPMFKIKGHENTVCCLKSSNTEAETFLSSSWDVTAKSWNVNSLELPKVTYLGHTAAVWCVADLPSGNVVTGSADKSVIVYLRDGKILHKLNAHTDCVRDIAVIQENEFLTCANDAIIKHWSAVTGDCLGNFYGHSNYIYSMSTVPGGSLAVSGGEDRTVRVWHNGEVDQTITLPAQSVWAVRLLPNGDIVCGSSDGVVRIFTSDTARYADSETQQRFEEAVVNSGQSKEDELGLKNLPDSSALSQPGKKDGETKLVKDGGGSVKAFSWSQSEMKWNLIGDVTGSNPENSGKQLFNGMEYDYVFSVDIQDGVPPLKLPYNTGQDPWHVAQKFIDDNNLSQHYLEQVANFIIKNSTPAPVVNNTSQFYDPFTGGNRYIPTSEPQTQSQPSLTPATKKPANETVKSSYIPLKNFLKLEQANVTVIREKLKEFNLNSDVQTVSEELLESVVKLATSNNKEAIASGAIDTLMSLMNWPKSVLIPVLDIARLAVLQKNVNERFCTDELYNILKRHLEVDQQGPNQMLAFRTLANMLVHETGEKLCLRHRDDLFRLIERLQQLGKANNQVALSTFLLNIVVSHNKSNDSAGKARVGEVILRVMPLIEDPEAAFRILVALGTLLTDEGCSASERCQLDQTVQQSDGALKFLQDACVNSDGPADKVATLAAEIISLVFRD